jgi:glycosyltransferase involved in cell wall biosynthesis
MRFSIITITFNAESFLSKTLDSLFFQKFIDFEHIIWDGGSEDRTLEIASSYPSKIHKGEDIGIADAMNKGAQLAKGEILLHLHADDLLAHENVLSHVDVLFKQYPNLDWLYGVCHTIDENGERITKGQFTPFSPSKLKKYNTIPHPATFVKRELFEKVGGFDPNLKYCMDYDLWLRLAQYSTPQAFPFLFSLFRHHQGSLSTREILGVADEAYKVRNRYIKNPIGRLRSYRTWKKRRALAN